MENGRRDIIAWLVLLGAAAEFGAFVKILHDGWSLESAAVAAFLGIVLIVLFVRRFGRNLWLRCKLVASLGRLSLSKRTATFRHHEWPVLKRLSEVALQLLSRDDLDVELLDEIIDEYGRVKPASKEQIQGAVLRVPILDRIPEPTRTLHAQHLIEDLYGNSIFFVRSGSHGGSVRLKFMETNFMVAQQRGKSIRIKPELLVATVEKFAGVAFDSLVFLKRDATTDGLFDHIEQLKEAVKARTSMAFPAKDQARRDPNWFTNFIGACANKRVLLVETWLHDDLLDKAWEEIAKASGQVIGVLVIFQSVGFNLAALRNGDAIRQACPTGQLEGQIILKVD